MFISSGHSCSAITEDNTPSQEEEEEEEEAVEKERRKRVKERMGIKTCEETERNFKEEVR